MGEKENVARNIKKVRLMRELTQSDLGERIGTSQEYVSFCESGRKPLGRRTLEKLSDGLGVPINVLLSDEIEVYVYAKGKKETI